MQCLKQVNRLSRLLMLAMMAGCNGSDNAKSTPAAPRASAAAPAAASNIAPGGNGGEIAAQLPVVNAPPASTTYGLLLAQIVADDGLVRYRLLASDELRKQMDASVDEFAHATLPAESDLAARKALWCNAYNANVLKMALTESQKEGFKTVNDVPGFFDQMTITVAGQSTTLTSLTDQLPALKDPRIHAALVSGAKSSPALRSKPYTIEGIDRELDDQTRAWLEDLMRNRVVTNGLRLSTIFKTYAADFEGEPYNGTVGFVRLKARSASVMRDVIRNLKGLQLSYMPFDWSLNDAVEDQSPTPNG